MTIDVKDAAGTPVTKKTLDDVVGTAGSANTAVLTVQGIASGVAQPVSATSLPLPTGAATAAKQPALGTAGTASTDVITVQGISSMTPISVSFSGQSVGLSAGSNLVGKVGIDQTTPGTTNGVQVNAALPAGTNIVGKVGIDQTTDGTTNAVSAHGDVASGSSDSGNPLKVGGLAKTALPTAVSDAQRVAALFDKFGRQIQRAALRETLGVQQTSISASTSETTIVTAGGAGVFNDLYGLILANTGATAVTVSIKDATAGTTRMKFYVPAGDVRGFTAPPDGAVVQAAAANNWTATCSASTTALEVTALYVTNK